MQQVKRRCGLQDAVGHTSIWLHLILVNISHEPKLYHTQNPQHQMTDQQKWKKALFPLISCFLAYKTYEILEVCWFLEPSGQSLLFQLALSFVLNLFITGCFAFVGFAYKTNQVLGENYYQVDNPTAVVQWYKFLKVEYFRKALLLLFWGRKAHRQQYFDGTKKGLDHFDYQTRQSEFGHLAALIFVQFAAVMVMLRGHYAIALWTTFLNVISNFYPIVLQRHHRINIERLRKILNRRKMT